MTVSFNVSTLRHSDWNGPKRYVRFYIYDTAAELQAAAADFNKRRSWGKFDIDGIAGIYHSPSYRERYDRKLKKWVPVNKSGWAGIVRLCKEYLSDEVVSHECFHAAVGIHRLDISKGGSITLEDGNPHEETLAYILGDIYGGTCEKLVKKGFWRAAE